MNKSIKLTIDGNDYTAVLNDNRTVDDILSMLPMTLNLQRFSGHEYYSALPQKPSIKNVPTTTKAHAGGIYYYDGWTAFTVLFEDAYVAPYKVVHVGDIVEDIATPLASAGNWLEVEIEKHQFVYNM